MGNQLSGIAPSQISPIESYLSDLNNKHYQNLIFDCSLGSTRFLKVVKVKTEEGLMVIKIFVIHDQSLALTQYREQILHIQERLQDAENCLSFHFTELTERAGFMVRPFVNKTLYDRISTRSFLTTFEKKWIAFQILCALHQCHRKNVCHGDIKLENILVSSWSWVTLTDFAIYKPVLLPEDNPTDYSYFFDTSRRRVCYIAPERFIKTLDRQREQLLKEVQDKGNSLTHAMDIFSAGCVMAEMFSEGVVPFDLTLLLRYRTDSYCPDLDKIEDNRIKNLIRHMINKNPYERKNAAEYLEQEKGHLFPEYFYTFLWPFVKQFSSNNSIPSDLWIAKIYQEIDNILHELVPNIVPQDLSTLSGGTCAEKCESLTVIVSLILSTVRRASSSYSKLAALRLFKILAPYTPDDIIIDRILPIIFCILHDSEIAVRAESIETLTICLQNICEISRSNINIFPDYIFPNISVIIKDESALVRESFARNIGDIADIADRVLAYGHEKNMTPSIEREVARLHSFIQDQVGSLFSDPSNSVKSNLLWHSVLKLCKIFGGPKAYDIILSHMITVLNEKKDHKLRWIFFKEISGVASTIGNHCADVLRPLLLQSLNDTEESVIIAAIEAMACLAEVNFFQLKCLLDLLKETLVLLIHPNEWIRQAVIGFVVTASRKLPYITVLTLVKTEVEPYLERKVMQFTREEYVMGSCARSLPKEVYDTLVKCPNVNQIITILTNASNRGTPIDDLHFLVPEVEVQTRSLLKRLVSAGLKESNLDYVIKLNNHLVCIQKHKKMAETAHEERQKRLQVIMKFTGSTPKVALTTYQRKEMAGDHSLNISGHSGSNQTISGGQSMNEEWQTMFGAAVSDETSMSSLENRSSPPLKSDISSTLLDQSSKTEESCIPPYLDCQKDFDTILMKKRAEYLASVKKQRLASSLTENSTFICNRWKPKGHLVSHFHEHEMAVHRLVQIKGKASFFASCSSEGVVKVWDCSKMERKYPVNRSRVTYKHSGVVHCLASCGVGDILASGSKNGHIQLTSLESPPKIVGNKYLNEETELHATDMHFMDSGPQSVLTYSTVYGDIVGWDIRAPPGEAWRLNNSVKKGLITSYAIDSSENSLTVGTSNGYHVCWDLRFKLPISEIVHPQSSGVRRLKMHPNRPSWIVSAMTGNNEVVFWDLETQSRMKTLWASSEDPLTPKKKTQTTASDSSVTGLYTGQTVSGEVFVITGGHDCKLRFWDMEEPENSFYISNSSLFHNNQWTVEYSEKVIKGSEVIIEKTRMDKHPSHTEESALKGTDQPPTGHRDSITDILVMTSPQKLIVTSSYDGTIKMWK